MAILHLHLYLPISSTYSVDDLVNYFRGRVDRENKIEHPDDPVDRFADAGVHLDFRSTAVHGSGDFKRSLQDSGSVVVYLGHSTLDSKNMRSVGLSPFGFHTLEIPAITVAKPGQPKPPTLMDFLQASRAKLVILATCASSTFGLEKSKVDPAVVVTNSGSNLTTWSNDSGLALKHFLLLLIGYKIGKNDQPYSPQATTNLFTGAVGAGVPGAVVSKLVARRATIREALEASNAGFKENGSTDRFELAHGEGSTVVFSE
jgi:hypothetical protein